MRAISAACVRRLAAALLACLTALTSGCGLPRSASSGGTPGGENASIRRPAASLIQAWYCKGWPQSRWQQELSQMKQAGFRFVILQAAVVMDYDAGAQKNRYGEDYTRVPLTGVTSLYPSDIPALRGADGGTDSLGNCLKAARACGMKVMIGPYFDSRWWLFGQKTPALAGGPAGASPASAGSAASAERAGPSASSAPAPASASASDLAADSYFARWTREDAAMSNRVAAEIWRRYGKTYAAQLEGWYLPNEIWNMQPACQGKDGGVLSAIVAEGLNERLDVYTKLTPGLPALLSPFVNFSLSTAAECGAMWKSVFRRTRFRSGDIFCPQDSIGSNPDKLSQLGTWLSSYRDAVKTKPGLKFWVNNESFAPGGRPALLNRVARQIAVSAPFCEQNILFSWNHYDCASAGVNAGYQRAYLQVVRGTLSAGAPGAPRLALSAGSARRIVITPDRARDVAGYYISRKGEAGHVAEIWSDAKAPPSGYTAARAGVYRVQAVNFAGNASAAAVIRVS